MDLLISYHLYMMEGLLSVMVLNLFVPSLFGGKPTRQIFYTRIGYFAFWALWSMTVFSGLIVFVFARRKWSIPVEMMVILSAILPLLDAYRAVRLKKIWLGGETGTAFSSGIVAFEIVLTISVWASAVYS